MPMLYLIKCTQLHTIIYHVVCNSGSLVSALTRPPLWVHPLFLAPEQLLLASPTQQGLDRLVCELLLSTALMLRNPR